MPMAMMCEIWPNRLATGDMTCSTVGRFSLIQINWQLTFSTYYVVIIKTLPQVFPIVHQRRLAIHRVGIIAHVYLQHLKILVVEVVRAFAVCPPVHRFGEIHMWYGVDVDVFQVDVMPMAKIIYLHATRAAPPP
jgi:hypothetical protein